MRLPTTLITATKDRSKVTEIKWQKKEKEGDLDIGRRNFIV